MGRISLAEAEKAGAGEAGRGEEEGLAEVGEAAAAEARGVVPNPGGGGAAGWLGSETRVISPEPAPPTSDQVRRLGLPSSPPPAMEWAVPAANRRSVTTGR